MNYPAKILDTCQSSIWESDLGPGFPFLVGRMSIKLKWPNKICPPPTFEQVILMSLHIWIRQSTLNGYIGCCYLLTLLQFNVLLAFFLLIRNCKLISTTFKKIR